MEYFYRFVALVYFFSFVSLYIQWPGLYGWNGLLPVDQFLLRVRPPQTAYSEAVAIFWQRFPSIFLFASDLGVSPEAMGETMLLLGMTGSSLCVWRGYQSSILFFLLWILYLSLVLVGQSFMSFQWDILLLEVGALAAIGRSPLFKQYGGPVVIKLLFRFMFWKLMFMAGVVKLYSNCPTWLDLTALEYHFATQPLPHGLSWFAHQLHPFLLRAGVAATLIIEIPLTFFCIAKFDIVRKVGVFAQVMLQLMIICTGNYNFFNILTLVLTIPAWSDEINDANVPWSSELHSSENKGSERRDRSKSSSTKASWLFNVGRMTFIVNIIAIFGGFMFQAKLIPPQNIAGIIPSNSVFSVLDRIQIEISPHFAKIFPTFVTYAGIVALGILIIFKTPHKISRLLVFAVICTYRCHIIQRHLFNFTSCFFGFSEPEEFFRTMQRINDLLSHISCNISVGFYDLIFVDFS